MPAPLARQFHGAPGPIEGNVVRPKVQGRGRSMDELAFSTSRVGDAMGHAGTKSMYDGRLFGSVYEVSPRNGRPSPLGDPKHTVSSEGMDVVKHVGFVGHEGKWANR